MKYSLFVTKNNSKNENIGGIILIELMVTLCLFVLLLGFLLRIFLLTYTHWSKEFDHRNTFEEMQYAIHYIDRMTKRMDQQTFQYDKWSSTLTCKNYLGETSYFDFSGNRRVDRNTYLYYDRNRGELMTNKNKEYNTLIKGVKELTVEYENTGLLSLQLEMEGSIEEYFKITRVFRINPKGNDYEQE